MVANRIYLVEILAAKNRGRWMNCVALMKNLGMLYINVVAMYLTPNLAGDENW